MFSGSTQAVLSVRNIDNGPLPEITVAVGNFDTGDRVINSVNQNQAVKVFEFSVNNLGDIEVNLRSKIHQAVQNEFVAGRGSPIDIEKLAFVLQRDSNLALHGNASLQVLRNAAARGELPLSDNLAPQEQVTYTLYAFLKDINAADQNGKVVRLSFKAANDISCVDPSVNNSIPCTVHDTNWVGDAGPDVSVSIPGAGANAQNGQLNLDGLDLVPDIGSVTDSIVAAANSVKVSVTKPLQPSAATITPGFDYVEVLKVGLNPNNNLDLDGVKLKLITENNATRSFLESRLQVMMYLSNQGGRAVPLLADGQYFGPGSVGPTREKMFSFPKVHLKSPDVLQQSCPCTLSVRVMHSRGTNQRFKIEANDYHFDRPLQPAFDGDKIVQSNNFTLAAQAVVDNGQNVAGVGVGNPGATPAAGIPLGGVVSDPGNAGAGNVGVVNGGAGISAPDPLGRNSGLPNGFNPNLRINGGANANGAGNAGAANGNGAANGGTPAPDPAQVAADIANAAAEAQRQVDAAAAASAEAARIASVNAAIAAAQEAARQKAAQAAADQARADAEKAARDLAAAQQRQNQQAIADAVRILASANALAQAQAQAAQQQMLAAQEAQKKALAEKVAAEAAAKKAQESGNKSNQTQQKDAQNDAPNTVHGSADTPNLSGSQRLVRAPERGAAGPETDIYVAFAALAPGLVAAYRRYKK